MNLIGTLHMPGGEVLTMGGRAWPEGHRLTLLAPLPVGAELAALWMREFEHSAALGVAMEGPESRQQRRNRERELEKI